MNRALLHLAAGILKATFGLTAIVLLALAFAAYTLATAVDGFASPPTKAKKP